MSNYPTVVRATTGLVSYWRLGETGASAADSQGVNTGTYLNTVTKGVAGALVNDSDGAATFSTDGRVQVEDHATLDLLDTFSLECWVKRIGTGGLISKGSNAYYIRVGSGNNLELLKSNAAQIVASTTTLDTNWHHCVATKSGATVKLYIDGVDRTGVVTNAAMADTTFRLNIGADTAANTPTEFFSGTIDEVAVYSVALSQTTVQEHYSSGASARVLMLTGVG